MKWFEKGEKISKNGVVYTKEEFEFFQKIKKENLILRQILVEKIGISEDDLNKIFGDDKMTNLKKGVDNCE